MNKISLSKEEKKQAKEFKEKVKKEKPNSPFTKQIIKRDSYLFDAFNQFTDYLEIAKQFVKKQPIYYDTAKLWWIWNFKEYRWVLIDETDLMNSIDQYTLKPSVNSKTRNEILEALKRVGRLNKPKAAKKTWIQFKDIVYDIKTGEEFAATPEYFITNPIPYELDKNKFMDTPVMDRIFEEWVGKDYVQTLYEIIAYCLLPDYPLHRIFCFLGGGMNGKGKFFTLLRKFVGEYNVCSTELDCLLSSRFEVARLHKKLVCQMGETNFNVMKKTSILKKLTGGDLIGYEYKNKNPFDDINYAKIMISTNNLPVTTDKTYGFFRRWLIVDFPFKFNEKHDILQDIPEVEYNALALKSVHILKDLMDKREFNNEGSVEDRMERYEHKSNPLAKFWNDYIVEDINAHIYKYEFKKKLDDWCVDNNFRILSDNTVAQLMKEKEIDSQQIQAEWFTRDGNKARPRAWVGIKWSDKK